jgi:hypothetical protein
MRDAKKGDMVEILRNCTVTTGSITSRPDGSTRPMTDIKKGDIGLVLQNDRPGDVALNGRAYIELFVRGTVVHFMSEIARIEPTEWSRYKVLP